MRTVVIHFKIKRRQSYLTINELRTLYLYRIRIINNINKLRIVKYTSCNIKKLIINLKQLIKLQKV